MQLIHRLAAFAAAFFFINAAQAQATVTVEPDVAIHYVEAGDRQAKTTFLFVPGWGTSNAVWRDQVAAFAQRGRVVAIDPRSQGLSTITPRGNTPERRARDLREVIRALGLANVVLVGWSQGVQDVAAYAAAFEGEQVAGYVLVDAAVSSGPSVAEAQPKGMRQQLERMGIYSRYPREYFKGMFEAIIASPAGRARIPELVETGMKTPPDLGIAMLMSDFILIDRRPALKKFNRPALVIAAASADDLEEQRAMAKEINAQFEAVPQAGHAVFLDQPAKFEQLLADFARRLG
jgi:microsomal epoxide hydrolase